MAKQPMDPCQFDRLLSEFSQVKATFHYASQVADLVADLLG